MKTNIHFWSYLAQLFLEWEMFHTKVVEKIQTPILCSITFSPKACHVWDNVKEYGRAGQITEDNIIGSMPFACWITNATDTHSEYVIHIAFPQQKWLHECASMLRFCVPCPLFHNVQTGCRAHSVHYRTSTRSPHPLHGRKRSGLKLRLWMNGAVPLLSLHNFMAGTKTKKKLPSVCVLHSLATGGHQT